MKKIARKILVGKGNSSRVRDARREVSRGFGSPVWSLTVARNPDIQAGTQRYSLYI